MANGPKKGKRKPNVVRTRVSTSSAVAIQAVQHEARDVLDDGGLLTGRMDQLARCGHRCGRSFSVGDDLDTGNERRRVGEVDTQEALGMGHGFSEGSDGNGGRVGTDHGIGAGSGADPGQGLVLDFQYLGNALLDEVGVGYSFLDVLGCPQVLLEDLCGSCREESVGDELVRLQQQAVVVLLRDLGRHIGKGNARATERQHLGDAAAHVAGADDGDLPGCVVGGGFGCFRSGHVQTAFV